MLSALSFRIRITLYALVCFFAGLLVLAGITGYQNRNIAKDQAFSAARLLAQSQAAQITSMFDYTESAVHSLRDTLVGMHVAGHAPSREQINGIMKEMLTQNTLVLAFSNMWEPNALDGRDADFVNKKPEHDKTGRFLPYWNRGSGQPAVEPLADYDKPGLNDWYEIPRNTMKDAMIEPYLYKVNGKDVLMTSLMSPMIANGKFIGVTGADFPLSGLQDRLGNVHPYDTGSVFLLSNGGLYATSADPALLAKPAKTLPAEALQAVKSGQPYQFVQNGIVYIFEPFSIGNGGTPWSLVVTFPVSAVMGPANQLLASTITVAAITLIVIAILLSLVIGRATRPLLALKSAMEQFAHGSGDLTQRLNVQGNDEIANISASFNTFADLIQSLVRDIRQKAKGVGIEGNHLGEIAEKVKEVVQQQTEGSSMALASVKALTENIGNVANSAQEVDLAVQGTDHLSHEVTESIQGTAELIAGIAQAMQEVKDQVVKLDDSTREINSIADVIKDIAGQTNLLALNAAIEAARAGEQGRGFAVVADEVRKLAERTTQATLQIGDMLSSVQSDTSRAVQGVDEATSKVDRSVGQTRDVVGSVRAIQEHIQTVAEQIASIAHATSDQSQSSQQVTHHIQTITDTAQQSQDAIAESRRAASRLQQAAQELLGQVEKFRVD